MDANQLTIEARSKLSNIHSDYFRQMGELGYRRVAVGEVYSTYWWSKKRVSSVRFLDELEPDAIQCPFQYF